MRENSLRAILILALSFVFIPTAHASESVGSIDDSFKLTRICKDTSCSIYGNANWKPTLNANTSGATAVSITDSGITGNVWGDEIGWINLSPTGGGVTINPNTGVLSGTAYATVGGWINFSTTGTSVSINSSGEFTGSAYVSGLNGGWMKFDCSSGSTCVKTDWRPIPNRSGTPPPPEPPPPSGGGGGGGSSFYSYVPTDSNASSPLSPITPIATTEKADIFFSFLDIGSEGAEVTALQQLLKDTGYYTGPVTGYFGPLTKAAVISFQKAKDIEPYPGWVGPGTRTVLNTLYKSSSSYTAPTVPTTPSGTTFISFLDIGSEGAEVTALQQLLKDTGYYSGPVTGYFGPLTQAGVIAFQKAKNIAPYPGYVGPGTRAALNTLQGNKTVVQVPPTTKVTKFVSHLSIGSEGAEVTALQQALTKYGFYTGSITGYFGPLTKAAVIEFQEANNIEPYPGWVGPGTQAALNALESR
jgi:peptidoglycan hydrolase-like protein with peptidoglycan-binding domain